MMATENPPRMRGGGPRSGGGGLRPLQRPIVYAARKQRRQMTLPEVLLWNELKGAKTGVSFRKQHPIGPYVVDFYRARAKLVIEVHGEVHNRGNEPMRDTDRDMYLVNGNHSAFRIAAADILRDMDGVLHRIMAEVEKPLRLLRGHLPMNGEDVQ